MQKNSGMNKEWIRLVCENKKGKTKDIVTLKRQTNYVLKMLWRKISAYFK